ncbi:MAG: SAM-dependent methyltransferase [Candidatus Binatia bacterium]|nr:MAG: SAM-dependent methyltransferase [Candidatus Binatia bacterium]
MRAEPVPHESKLYYEFSHVYDHVFGRVFGRRIRGVVESLCIPPGAKVLEVGVGTGLSLEAYPRHCHVVGIDLAPDMLQIAQEKVNRHGWRHVTLMEMDAQKLSFPDDSFDYVTAFHVVSVVPDPRRAVAEMARVLKPGGTLVVINHFRSRNPVLARLDRWIEPVTRRLGWRALDLDEVFAGSPVRPKRTYRKPGRSLFTIVIARNEKTAPLSGASPRGREPAPAPVA